jgi:glycerophosphoryl diester phosphodiesterase
MASFDRALADGCDGFEFDVRLTGDGEAVICHDPKLGRFEIARAKAQQVSSLALLQDVFRRYRKAFLVIELKVGGLEKIVAESLQEFRPERFVVSSFLPDVLRAVHDADVAIPLGLICETKAQLRAWREVPAEYVFPHQKLANPELTEELRVANRKIVVWTVNSAAAIRRIVEMGVDGIISDNPRVLVQSMRAETPGTKALE